MNKKQTLFIADLHLDSSRPEMRRQFLSFIDNRANQAQALYILGDLFESWVGDDDHTAFNQAIITAIRRLSDSGVPVYIMHGNRDFLLGSCFEKATGCQIIKDPHLIDLYGTKTLLMHGDLLCTDDVSYMRYRKKVRHPLVQKIFLKLPLSWRQLIAQKIRRRSQHYLSTASKAVTDVTAGEDIKIMDKHQTPLLIHGHTHRPAIHSPTAGKTRIVLAAWHEQGNVLVCQADTSGALQYELVYF